MLDVDLEGEGIPQEEDEITFAGETESAFFNYLKRGLNFDEDANTVATTAVDAIGSVYSTKTSILSKKYKDIHDKLTEQKQARQNLEEEVKKMKARDILTSLAGALRGGGVKPAAHLDIRTDVERLRIEHDTPFPYQLDGDALGESTRLDIAHVPDAIRLVFPSLG